MAGKKRRKRTEASRSKRRGFKYNGNKRRPSGTRQTRQPSATVEHLKTFAKRNQVTIRAYLIFLFCILSFATVLVIAGDAINPSLRAFVARITGSILSSFGAQVQVSGTTVQSPDFAVDIVPACTGIFTIAIFLSAVFAYPCRSKEKMVGTAIGIPTIFLVNLIRVVSLFYIGSFFPSIFDTAHFLIWQSLVILSAVVLWLFWAGKFANVAHH